MPGIAAEAISLAEELQVIPLAWLREEHLVLMQE
jgi:hypothetical protein